MSREKSQTNDSYSLFMQQTSFLIKNPLATEQWPSIYIAINDIYTTITKHLSVVYHIQSIAWRPMHVWVHWLEPTVFQIFLNSGILFRCYQFLFFFVYFSRFYIFSFIQRLRLRSYVLVIWEYFNSVCKKCNNNNKNHIGSYSCIICIALFRVHTPTWKIISHKPLFIADFMATAKKPDGTNKWIN